MRLATSIFPRGNDKFILCKEIIHEEYTITQ